MKKRKKPRKGKYKPVIERLSGKIPQETKVTKYSKGETKERTIQLNLRSEPLVWGFPMDEVLFSKFFTNLPNLNIMPWDAIITTESTYLPDARNMIHTAFINSDPANNWLAMIDSDVLIPPWTIDTLMKYDKPLSGGWYKHKVAEDGMYNPVVYDYLKSEEDDRGWDVNWYKRRKYPSEGLERVDALGAGCLLMRRDLAEALGERPYDMNAGGEDMVLCKKVYDLGFDIHVDWSLACAHIGVSYV